MYEKKLELGVISLRSGRHHLDEPGGVSQTTCSTAHHLEQHVPAGPAHRQRPASTLRSFLGSLRVISRDQRSPPGTAGSGLFTGAWRGWGGAAGDMTTAGL